MKIPFILAWILWAVLLLSWPTNLLIAFLSDTPNPAGSGQAPPLAPTFIGILAFIGFATLALTFLARWFFLRFLINPNRIPPDSAWGGILFFIAAFIIWSMTKSVDTYGLVLFFQSQQLPLYLAFSIPSLLVFLLHMPHLLKPKHPLQSQS
jgi:hypothetical protein